VPLMLALAVIVAIILLALLTLGRIKYLFDIFAVATNCHTVLVSLDRLVEVFADRVSVV
jgi:hypothetical protein